MDKVSFTWKFNAVICWMAIGLGSSSCLARGTDFAQIYDMPGTFTQVSFATLESQVLAPKCLSCHADFSTAQGIQPYITAGDPQNSALYTEITSGDMPPGGPTLPSGSQAIVAEYIQQLAQAATTPNELAPEDPGAPVAPSSQPSASPAPGVSYAMLKQAILVPKCIECHQNFGTEAGLKDYVVAGNPSKSSLYQASASGSMPPGGPALSADDLTMIKTYIMGISSE